MSKQIRWWLIVAGNISFYAFSDFVDGFFAFIVLALLCFLYVKKQKQDNSCHDRME